jgi:pimeloyl-ACP methyl ester carboxylesterase
VTGTTEPAPAAPLTSPPTGRTRRRPGRPDGYQIAIAILTALTLVAAGVYVVNYLIPSYRPAAVPPSAPTTIALPPRPSPTSSVPTAEPLSQPDRPTLPVPDVVLPGFIDPPPGQGLARYDAQEVAWRDCRVEGVGGLCAQVAAPLDWAEPDGQAITLAVFRRPGRASQGGAIFVNPGGPGVGGQYLAALFDPPGLEAYDLIGWDPRGTGQSTPVVCPGGASLDALLGLDASPDDNAEFRDYLQAWADFGQGCLAGSGKLLSHVATADTVADLDLLRRLLGQEKLDYIGFSYGTYIGAMYADRHPESVGHMVLDSAVDISDDDAVAQSAGFELTWGQYDDWCAQSGCPDEVRKDSVLAWLNQLDQAPLAVGQRWLTQSQAVLGLATYMYHDQSTWPALVRLIQRARQGDGAGLLESADQMWERNRNGTYSNLLAGFSAISCLDWADQGISAALRDWSQDSLDSPLFGRLMGPMLECVKWPVQARPSPPLTATGAAPILVIGSTGDSATPYAHAVSMAAQLDSAVLLTYDGPGHTSYGSGRSACVDQAVRDYFLGGVLPGPGARCT